MKMTRFVVRMFSIGAMILGADGVSSQDFPNKPIRVVTSLAGGGVDFIARLIAQGITGPLGQQVIVDNRSTFLTAEIVSKAPPDGYTLLVASSPFFVGPFLQKVLYHPVRDFSPITLVSKEPSILVVHPSVAANSVKELIALAKARPGELRYSSAVRGSSLHLSAELFKSMAGVNIVSVAYKGTGAGVIGVLSGEVQMIFVGATSVASHTKSGKLRALAVTSAQPSALAPGLPTVAAAGLPGFEFVGIDLVFAPAGTPAAAINRLNREMVRFLNTAGARERLFNSGVEAVGSSPEELAATMKSEMTKLGKLIKDLGITID